MNITPTDITNAEHYLWGNACHGWRLLNQDALSVVQERVPPGMGEVKHFHTWARQFFYMLQGVAAIEFDHQTVIFQAGQGVPVEPGVAHRFVNQSSEEVVFLVISTPTTIGDRTNVE